MRPKTVLVICAAAIAVVMLTASCVPAVNFGPVDNRPGIPVPDSYSSAVALVSDELIVASVVPSTFNPSVTEAYNATGTKIYDGVAVRVELRADDTYITNPLVNGNPGVALTDADGPQFAFIRYWRRIGDAVRYAGGVTISESRSVTRGASQTSTNTFTESISIEAEASAGGLFAEVTVSASASFTASQEFMSTTMTEETVTETFTAAPPPEINLIFTVWQLVEEYRFVDANGELYDHPKYVFDDSSLRFVFPTDEVIPITFTYPNK